MAVPTRIKKWLRRGLNNDLRMKSVAGLLERAGRALDKAYAHEIMGEVVFIGEDGKTYVGTVEFVIQEASPEYVKQVTSSG